MNRTVILAALAALVIVGAAGSWIMRGSGTPPLGPVDPTPTLSPVPAEDGGTEPVALPATPVLKALAGDPGHLALAFVYSAGGVPYAYRLRLDFAPGADKGTMVLDGSNGAGPGQEPIPVERRWSETRKAYLVAVSRDLAALSPPLPSLCIRAVLGPDKERFDLGAASLCVMQRDQTGRCHPTTLACGLIR